MHQSTIKAVGLLSGGLDSTIAAKLILEQGIEVHAINFTSPFCTCTPKQAGCAAVITAVRQLGNVKLKRVALGPEYLKIVQNPKHGHGTGLNPCLDCRILKIQKAGEYMREIGAKFIFTGEVLGQRPMSQHKRALAIIDRDSGLGGLILRPLSAAKLAPTIPEQEGWVDRDRLLGLSGRSRKPQMALAASKNILDYPCPAGGCLLTDKNFAQRLRDYFTHTPTPSLGDMALLKIGRHFRIDNGDKVIVARDEGECRRMDQLCKEDDHLIKPIDFAGPSVILKGSRIEAAVAKLKRYTRITLNESARVLHRHKSQDNVLYLHQFEDNHWP